MARLVRQESFKDFAKGGPDMTLLELMRLSAVWEFLSRTLNIIEKVAQKAEAGDTEAARLIFELAGLLPTREGERIEQTFTGKNFKGTNSCGDSRKETPGADRTGP
jgi:hypothetical protein